MMPRRVRWRTQGLLPIRGLVGLRPAPRRAPPRPGGKGSAVCTRARELEDGERELEDGERGLAEAGGLARVADARSDSASEEVAI